jgi:uncharacterized protein with HEPN domain
MLENETIESFLHPESMTIQDAVVRRFTIIGEASAAILKKYPDFCNNHSEIPLRKARGLRNAIVHDYDGIDWNIIWKTSMNDLPKLISAIKPFLSNNTEKY